MDLLDLIVVAAAIAAGVGGYRLGFLGRVASWAGLALGFYVALRILPSLILDFRSSSPGVLVGLATIVLIGGALAGQALGMIAGYKLHRALPLGPVRQADRAVGAVFGAFGVIVVLWVLIPAVAAVPGWPAQATQRSGISRWVSRNLPAPPSALQVLRRLIGNDAPQVFAVLRPGTPSGPPPPVSPLPRAVELAVAKSTVKVEGQACDRLYEGSGFAVGPDLVVTNADVVAGESRGNTAVLLPTGVQLAATVVMFDPRRDLAILDVHSLDEKALPLRAAHSGAIGAVFGHPGGQDAIAVSPFRVVQEEEAVGKDLYDNHDTKRDILVLASSLAHGDSGGPLVVPDGSVIGVAFAIAADQSSTAYALSVTEVEGALSESRNASGVSTGSCLTG